jgi:hypothetical protein
VWKSYWVSSGRLVSVTVIVLWAVTVEVDTVGAWSSGG